MNWLSRQFNMNPKIIQDFDHAIDDQRSDLFAGRLFGGGWPPAVWEEGEHMWRLQDAGRQGGLQVVPEVVDVLDADAASADESIVDVEGLADAAGMLACVMEAGWLNSVSTPPRLSARQNRRVRLRSRRASCRGLPPARRMADHAAARRASGCEPDRGSGWFARAGVVDPSDPGAGRQAIQAMTRRRRQAMPVHPDGQGLEPGARSASDIRTGHVGTPPAAF